MTTYSEQGLQIERCGTQKGHLGENSEIPGRIAHAGEILRSYGVDEGRLSAKWHVMRAWFGGSSRDGCWQQRRSADLSRSQGTYDRASATLPRSCPCRRTGRRRGRRV